MQTNNVRKFAAPSIAGIVGLSLSFCIAGAAQAGDRPATSQPSSVAPDLAKSYLDQTFGKVELKPTHQQPTDPIAAVDAQMQEVVAELTQHQTGVPVQETQERIVSELDVLIQMLQKQCKGSGGGGSNPTSPMNQSVLAKGPGGSGPLHDPQAGTRVWGQLPPRERQKILQSQTEGFPPGYESVLANYFNRLAQEQASVESSGNAPEPTTRPAGR
jgi:hypothetical protein